MLCCYFWQIFVEALRIIRIISSNQKLAPVFTSTPACKLSSCWLAIPGTYIAGSVPSRKPSVAINWNLFLRRIYVCGPKGSMGVLLTIKSKMAASNAGSGANSKSTGSRPIWKLKQIALATTTLPSHIRTHVNITNYIITAREGFTIKFQTEGWNVCFVNRATWRGP